MAVSKSDLNQLIQQLSEDDLPIAADFLKSLVNKSDRHIPWDDEPTTEDDLKAIKEAKESFARGEGIKLKDVLNDLLN
ncbi:MULTISPECIES: hypothetical protein [unclassified Cohnella]|uniref:hypothetical protein n=1 Tax=unclassified Cohnella TaxID=2636738 RepID=UPI00118066A0|nr:MULTISPECIES: hypothetical protein [unclassified Cohnella]